MEKVTSKKLLLTRRVKFVPNNERVLVSFGGNHYFGTNQLLAQLRRDDALPSKLTENEIPVQFSYCHLWGLSVTEYYGSEDNKKIYHLSLRGAPNRHKGLVFV